MVKKNKSVKNNGTYIFGDFSYGLYLLETPRGLGEQLASLALRGGQNIWCEKGALVPQYGCAKKPSIGEDDRIVAVSKDSYSGSSFFIVCQSGKIYYYSAAQGIKQYKTEFEETPTNVILARRGNDLMINMAGGNYVFGSYYDSVDDDDAVDIDQNVPAADYTTFVEFQVPTSSEKYYWTGKEIDIAGIGKGTVTDVSNGTGTQYADIDLTSLKDSDYHLQGNITVSSDTQEITLIGDNAIKVTEEEISEEKIIESDTPLYKCYSFYSKYYKECSKYSGDDLKFFKVGGLQVGYTWKGYFYVKDDAKVGDTIYAVKYSSHPSYVQYYDGKTAKGGYGYGSKASSESDLIPFKIWGRYYAAKYSSYQTVKYTYVITSMSNGVVTGIGPKVSNKTSSGVSYVESGNVGQASITETTTKTVRNINFNLLLENGTSKTYTTDYLADGIYTWNISYDEEDKKVTITVDYVGSAVATFEEENTNLDMVANAEEGDVLQNVILLDEDGNIANQEEVDVIIVRVTTANSDRGTLGSTATLREKTKHEVLLKYRPEDSENTDLPYEEDSRGKYYAITPQLMEWCNNRWYIEDISGNIFYSQVGTILITSGTYEGEAGFNESYGAGYFGGFYNDTSNLLAFDDFKGGVLITKENGMYYLTLDDTTTYTQSSDYLTVSSNSLKIEKISEIGQKYPQDHVVVKNQVYAYDSNSGTLVNAISQNVFGSLVAGKIMVSADYLNAQNLGIDTATRRSLVYNSEAGVFILYYGESLTNGIVYSPSYDSLFPRKLNFNVKEVLAFNQGVMLIDDDTNDLYQDFKKGTIIQDIAPVADFEAIGLRDNRFICSSIMEITELNGVEYDVTTSNIGLSNQHVQPNSEIGKDKALYPNMLYSEYGVASRTYDSFELTSKWAEKNSNLSRIYAPMSGRYGVSISFRFPENQDFCLSMIRLPDFSQGE